MKKYFPTNNIASIQPERLIYDLIPHTTWYEQIEKAIEKEISLGIIAERRRSDEHKRSFHTISYK